MSTASSVPGHAAAPHPAGRRGSSLPRTSRPRRGTVTLTDWVG